MIMEISHIHPQQKVRIEHVLCVSRSSIVPIETQAETKDGVQASIKASVTLFFFVDPMVALLSPHVRHNPLAQIT